jgi:hypothetical protein
MKSASMYKQMIIVLLCVTYSIFGMNENGSITAYVLNDSTTFLDREHLQNLYPTCKFIASELSLCIPVHMESQNKNICGDYWIPYDLLISDECKIEYLIDKDKNIVRLTELFHYKCAQKNILRNDATNLIQRNFFILGDCCEKQHHILEYAQKELSGLFVAYTNLDKAYYDLAGSYDKYKQGYDKLHQENENLKKMHAVKLKENATEYLTLAGMFFILLALYCYEKTGKVWVS